MNPPKCVYVGVDFSSSQRPFCYVVLDEERQTVAIGQGRLKDLLAYLAGLSAVRVALNGPATAPDCAPQAASVDASRAATPGGLR
ncbi:MAG TPA: hypothetical protein VHO48_08250, partial [Anaerolineaceae bacterium]|nr:hypothetical protein [Anaerolineaceae bacterium]